jgi:hypothetical protein
MATDDWDVYARRQPCDEGSLSAEPCQMMRIDKVVDRCVGRVLDVGGGDGYVSRRLMDAGHKVTMTEKSEVRAKRAQELGVEVKLDEPPRFIYDTVLLGEVLEHLDDPGELLKDAFDARERVVITLPLDGWPDPTHKWRISLDVVEAPSPHTDGRPSPQRQIVLTFQRGDCWPTDYHTRDTKWREQFENGR